MSVEGITRALQCEETTPMDVSTAETTSSEDNQTPLTTPAVNKTIERVGEETVGKTAWDSSGECRKKDSNSPNPGPSSVGKEVLTSPQDASRVLEDEIVPQISDISDKEEGERSSRQAKKPREGERKTGRKYGDTSNNTEPAVLKEEYTSTSPRVAKLNSPPLVDIWMEKENTDTTGSNEVMRDVDDVINKDDVMSEVDTCEGLVVDEAASESSDEDSDIDVEVSELDATKLLEMEMRRRALESVLKKFSQKTDQTTRRSSQSPLADDRSASDEEECNFLSLDVSESEHETDDSQHQSTKDSRKRKGVSLEHRESRDDEVKVEPATMDIGQLLEMKLRQKALQSLLNKKKQTSTQ